MKKIKYILLILLLLPIVANAKYNNTLIERDRIEIKGGTFSPIPNMIKDSSKDCVYLIDNYGNITKKLAIEDYSYMHEYRYHYQDYTAEQIFIIEKISRDAGNLKIYDAELNLIIENNLKNDRNIEWTGENYIIQDDSYFEGEWKNVYDGKINFIKRVPSLSQTSGVTKDYLITYNSNSIESYNLKTDERKSKNIKRKNNVYPSILNNGDILLDEYSNYSDATVLSPALDKEYKIFEDGYNIYDIIGNSKKGNFLIVYKKEKTNSLFEYNSYEEMINTFKVVKYDDEYNKISESTLEEVLDELPKFIAAKERYNMDNLKDIFNSLRAVLYALDNEGALLFQSTLTPEIYNGNIYCAGFLPQENFDETYLMDLYLFEFSDDLKEYRKYLIAEGYEESEGSYDIFLVKDDEGLAVILPNGDEYPSRISYLKRFDLKKEYHINYIKTEQGNIIAPKTAEANTKITLEINPNEGYVLSGLYLIDTEGNKEYIKENSFIMPNHDVTIEAIFDIINPDTSLNQNYIIFYFLISFITLILLLIYKPKNKFKKI